MERRKGAREERRAGRGAGRRLRATTGSNAYAEVCGHRGLGAWESVRIVGKIGSSKGYDFITIGGRDDARYR